MAKHRTTTSYYYANEILSGCINGGDALYEVVLQYECARWSCYSGRPTNQGERSERSKRGSISAIDFTNSKVKFANILDSNHITVWF